MNKLIIGNLKTLLDANDIVNYLRKTSKIKSDGVIVCPTSIYIPFFLKEKYNVGLQDVSIYDSGSHTGEVLAKQAASLGIKYTLVGHSDLNDSTEIINKKIIAANKYGITSILCVGEEKQSKKEKKYLKQYIKECLNNVMTTNLIIAYEPKWAIGTNIIPENKDIKDITLFIKEVVKEEFNFDVKVLYGGSVSKQNIQVIKNVDEIDGILVGNASTMPQEFVEIIDTYLR